jgi:hypothetical protein
LTVMMGAALAAWAVCMNWLKLVSDAGDEPVTVWVSQLYASAHDPPGYRIAVIPAAFSRPGIALSFM